MDLRDVLERMGRKIAEIRRGVGWTQERTASKLGVDLKDYQRIEAGRRNITARTMLEIADVFGVDLIELLRRPRSMAAPKPGRPRTGTPTKAKKTLRVPRKPARPGKARPAGERGKTRTRKR